MIKCTLCGGEWVPGKEFEDEVQHPENECDFFYLGELPKSSVMIINAAIEEARVDQRKPEDCTEYGSNYWDALPLIAVPETELVRCKMGLKKQHCPCAYFAKKEKS